MTIEERIQRIKSVLSQDNQIIFFVEHENQLGGFLGAYSGDFHRNRPFAYIVISILQEFMDLLEHDGCHWNPEPHQIVQAAGLKITR